MTIKISRDDNIVLSMLEILKTLAEAEEDVKNGRVASMQSSFDDLRASL
jgi:hypothetical protein